MSAGAGVEIALTELPECSLGKIHGRSSFYEQIWISASLSDGNGKMRDAADFDFGKTGQRPGQFGKTQGNGPKLLTMDVYLPVYGKIAVFFIPDYWKPNRGQVSADLMLSLIHI